MNTAPLVQHHVAADRIHALVASFTIIHLSKFCLTYVLPCTERGRIVGDLIFLQPDFLTAGQNFWSNPHVLDSDKVS